MKDRKEMYWELFNKTGYISAYLRFKQYQLEEEAENFPEASNQR